MSGVFFRFSNVLTGHLVDASHKGFAGGMTVDLAVDVRQLGGGGDDLTGLLPGDGPVAALAAQEQRRFRADGFAGLLITGLQCSHLAVVAGRNLEGDVIRSLGAVDAQEPSGHIAKGQGQGFADPGAKVQPGQDQQPIPPRERHQQFPHLVGF